MYSEIILLLEVAGLRALDAGSFSLPATIFIEFLIISIPTMISFTFTEYTLPMLATVYVSAMIFNRLSWKHAREDVLKFYRKEKMNQLLNKELPFLTCFRAQIMLSTYVEQCVVRGHEMMFCTYNLGVLPYWQWIFKSSHVALQKPRPLVIAW